MTKATNLMSSSSLRFQILDVWIFGKFWCRGWLISDVWISTASILNLCAISVDRYVAVSRPVKYRSIMTPRRAKTIVAGVWVVSFLICFPPLLLPQWNPSDSLMGVSQQLEQQPTTTTGKRFVRESTPTTTSSAELASLERWLLAANHQNPEETRRTKSEESTLLSPATGRQANRENKNDNLSIKKKISSTIMVIDNRPTRARQEVREYISFGLSAVRSASGRPKHGAGPSRSLGRDKLALVPDKHNDSRNDNDNAKNAINFTASERKLLAELDTAKPFRSRTSSAVAVAVGARVEWPHQWPTVRPTTNILTGIASLTGRPLLSKPATANANASVGVWATNFTSDSSGYILHWQISSSSSPSQTSDLFRVLQIEGQTTTIRMNNSDNFYQNEPANSSQEATPDRASAAHLRSNKLVNLLTATTSAASTASTAAASTTDSPQASRQHMELSQSTGLETTQTIVGAAFNKLDVSSKHYVHDDDDHDDDDHHNHNLVHANEDTKSTLSSKVKHGKLCERLRRSLLRFVVVFQQQQQHKANEQQSSDNNNDCSRMEARLEGAPNGAPFLWRLSGCCSVQDKTGREKRHTRLSSVQSSGLDSNSNHNQDQQQQATSWTWSSQEKTGCALFDDKPYVLYSSLGSFYIPMLIMIFFYSRIYLVASRAQRAMRRGYMTTKWPADSSSTQQSSKEWSGLANQSQWQPSDCVQDADGQQRVTLRIHRREKSPPSNQVQVEEPRSSLPRTARFKSNSLLRLSAKEAAQARQAQQADAEAAKLVASSAAHVNQEQQQQQLIRDAAQCTGLQVQVEEQSSTRISPTPNSESQSQQVQRQHQKRRHCKHHRHRHRHQRQLQNPNEHKSSARRACRHSKQSPTGRRSKCQHEPHVMRSVIAEESSHSSCLSGANAATPDGQPTMVSCSAELNSSLNSVQITITEEHSQLTNAALADESTKSVSLSVKASPWEDTRSLSAGEPVKLLQIDEPVKAKQVSRIDRSHSCGPTPEIVVSWNAEHEQLESKLSSGRRAMTAEPPLNSPLEHLEVQLEADKNTSSGLRLMANLPSAASQMRKQSMMLLSTITSRSTQTLRRLSMVASQPVGSLLSRTRSRDVELTSGSDTDLNQSADQENQPAEGKKRRKRRHKCKSATPANGPKRTLDDYLMALAGIDDSSDELNDEHIDDDDEEEDDEDDHRQVKSSRNLASNYSLLLARAAERAEQVSISNQVKLDEKSASSVCDIVIDLSKFEENSNSTQPSPVQETQIEEQNKSRAASQDDELEPLRPPSALRRQGGYYERATSRTAKVNQLQFNSESKLGQHQSGGLKKPLASLVGVGKEPTRTLKRTSRWHAKRLRAETKAAKTVAIIVGGFIFCWLPFFTAYLSRALICTKSDCVPQSLLSVFIWLGYLNSAINPIIYGLFSVVFRDAFKNILCGCRFRNNDDTVVVSVLVDNIIKSIL